MATYRKRGDRWRAEVLKSGVRQSASFQTKSHAIAWATEIEAGINNGKNGVITAHITVHTLVTRYITEVSPTKRGGRAEAIRLTRFLRELYWVGELVSKITVDHINGWRDQRLKEVSPASVNRELNILSAVFETARRDWRLCNINPVRECRRPKNPPHRDRLIDPAEIDAMLAALHYTHGCTPTQVMQRVAVAFLFGLETAMRQGEIAELTWDRVFVDKRYCRLAKTKNGDARNVPLSTTAIALLNTLPVVEGDSRCFRIDASSASSLWRKIRARVAVSLPSVADLHFHDARHEAITRLARKIDVLDLARMIGHRDPRSLMIYYNATATDIAGRLG